MEHMELMGKNMGRLCERLAKVEQPGFDAGAASLMGEFEARWERH